MVPETTTPKKRKKATEKEEEDNDEDYKEKLPDLEDLEDTVIEDQGIHNVQCWGSGSYPWVWGDADPENDEDYKEKLTDHEVLEDTLIGFHFNVTTILF